MQAHGAILLLAWTVLAPVAVALMAATRASPARRPAILRTHATLQATVVVATAAGLPLGLLLPVAGSTPHKCTGYAALAVAALPLTAAVYRPPPGASRTRAVWATCHRAAGLAALALAFVSGALGAARTHMAVAAAPVGCMLLGGAVLACGYVAGWLCPAEKITSAPGDGHADKQASGASSNGDGTAASNVPSTRAPMA